LYPNRPTAASGAAGSLWWKHINQGTQQICATQGLTFAKQLQARLAGGLPNTQWTNNSPPINGSTFVVDQSSIPIPYNGIIGANELAALWIIGTAMSLPADWLTGIVSDINQPYNVRGSVGGALSFPTMEAILFVGGSTVGDPVGNLQISTDVVPYTFGLMPPDDSISGMSGQVVCWNDGDSPPANLVQWATSTDPAPAGLGQTGTSNGQNMGTIAGTTNQSLVDVGGASTASTTFAVQALAAGLGLTALGLLAWRMRTRGRR
jgi:hypothetical protein